MPTLGKESEGSNLQNISPVRIEVWMPKVFYYALKEGDDSGEMLVCSKVFCMVTITPVANMNLAEYLRHNIVEGQGQGTCLPGLSLSASEIMRKDRKVRPSSQIHVCVDPI